MPVRRRPVVVLAPDSFKESMSAVTAAAALARGIHTVDADVECRMAPMADGGEGTAATLVAALGGSLVRVASTDALGRRLDAVIGHIPEHRLAIVEVAAACGLALIDPAARDIWRSSSHGVGALVTAALDRGARHLIVGLGGTATNDAGAGMLQALGARLRGSEEVDLSPGPAALADLATIDLSDLDARLATVRIDLACDVDNPLVGPQGASATFGPQKGATPRDVPRLDAALTRWADVVEAATGRRVRDLPGAGAAGGLAAAFLAVTDAQVRSGIDVVADAVALDDLLAGADWVFTGEGRVDAQTLHGKVVAGVARRAARHGVPVVAFAGRVDLPPGTQLPGLQVVAITPPGTPLPQALAEGEHNLEAAAAATFARLRSIR